MFLSTLVLLAAWPIAPQATPQTFPQTEDQRTVAGQVVDLVNRERVAHGCRPLAVDARLTSAAQGHSLNMAATRFFAHQDPQKRQPWDRMEQAGYRYSMASENIAAGYPTPERVVRGWMNSPGHRANILNCALRETGVGYVRIEPAHKDDAHRTYWTQNFGVPR